ncbi:hypothetical protein Dtox_1780 [Desulfofarcimen acetoxidans DSM 771]|uniref:Uncharacterized protein n=1 Tax=Desulfofarcimen acetoxidans (strain ATCC 49208 / DSM 771 / KCTC 5769 / VKM B-1644 / 5575) TaxID=485916 RepID=C8VX57_DESAS|nr:hypothetical protein [Desulfofarcimen acetoxidans]ACV62633.1 hypothetical protein Dtox_1780 [Desulfofarcimen acetoxidans DSM 771]
MERNQCFILLIKDMIKTFPAFSAAVIFILLIFAQPAASQASVTVQAVPGLNGIYKQSRPLEIKISVNNDGPAINGYVKLVPKDDEGRPLNYMTAYRRSVEIPAGTNYKTVMLIFEENGPLKADVELWSGNSRLAKAKIQGTTVDQRGSIILALNEKTLQGGLMSYADKTFGLNSTVKYLPIADLPADYFALSVADVIVVEPESIGQLNAKQVSVIKDWVKLGGKLILSEGAGTAANQPFAEFCPPSNNTADLFKISAGRGTVIYSRPGVGNVSGTDKEYWESFIKQYADSDNKNVKEVIINEGMRNNGNLVDTSSYIPQLKFPSLSSLAVFWVIYLLLVGPLVYYILKRYDRRELAWIVIPVFSLVASVAVFLASPSQKLPDPFGQTLSIIEILDEHLAEVRSAGSFITVKGGLLQVESPQDAIVFPVNVYSSMKEPNEVEIKNNSQEISYRNVEYWSIRQASLYTLWSDYGRVEADLQLTGNRIVGKVKNATKTDLKNCKIQVAGRLIDLGELSIGKEIQVSEDLSKWPILNRWGNMEERQRQERIQKDTSIIREERMLSDKLGTDGQLSTRIEFSGWSEQKSSLFQIKQAKNRQEQNNLTLVRQYFPLQLPAGVPVKLPPGLVPAQVTDGFYGEEPGGVVSRGDITFEYNLNGLFAEAKFVLQTVHIGDLPETALQNGIKIYDWQKNAWVEFKPGKKSITGVEMTQGMVSLSGEDLNRCLSTEKELRLKLSGGEQKPKIILPPQLSIEGVTQ